MKRLLFHVWKGLFLAFCFVRGFILLAYSELCLTFKMAFKNKAKKRYWRNKRANIKTFAAKNRVIKDIVTRTTKI
jgi:hypothetical protein